MDEVRTYHVGGSFAPALTDAHLKEYAEVAEGCSDPHTKRIIKHMLGAVAAWKGCSDKPSEGEEHPVKNFRGPSGEFVVPMIRRLHPETKKTLADHIISPQELKAWSEMVDELQMDVHGRNAQKIEEWKNQVGQAVWNKLHPQESRTNFLRRAEANVNVLRCVEDYSDHFGHLLPDLQAAIEVIGTTEDEFQRAYHPAIHDGSGQKLVSYPQLENDRQRVAAGHLLWHLKELAAGREPCTTEQLVAG